MRATILIFMLFIIFSNLQSQIESPYSRYELFGIISYNYSNTKYQLAGGPNPHILATNHVLETHAVTVQPAGGYFLTTNIELLFDLQYMFSYSSDTELGGEKIWDHSLGFDIGVAYNYQINPMLSIFLGTKVGINWPREITKIDNNYIYDGYYYDSGWLKRQIALPVFLLGERCTVSKYWSLLIILEYRKTNQSLFNSMWTAYKEDVSLWIGFSVFL